MKKIPYLLSILTLMHYATAGVVVIDAQGVSNTITETRSSSVTPPPKAEVKSIVPPVVSIDIPQKTGSVVSTMPVRTPQPQRVSTQVNTTPPVAYTPKVIEPEPIKIEEKPMGNWRINTERLSNDLQFGKLTYEQLLKMPTLEGGPQEWRYIPETNVIFNVNWLKKVQ